MHAPVFGDDDACDDIAGDTGEEDDDVDDSDGDDDVEGIPARDQRLTRSVGRADGADTVHQRRRQGRRRHAAYRAIITCFLLLKQTRSHMSACNLKIVSVPQRVVQIKTFSKDVLLDLQRIIFRKLHAF